MDSMAPTPYGLWALRLAILLSSVAIVDAQLFSDLERRPRLFIREGSMYFQAGYDRNITFRAEGRGTVILGNTPVETIQAKYREMSSTVRSTKDMHRFSMMITKRRMRRLEFDLERQQAKITQLEAQLNEAPRFNLNDTKQSVLRLIEKIREDDCTSRPCQHGGTCIDQFETYTCLCLEYYEGKSCETKISQCEKLSGSPLGCQNGATCTDLANGFECKCPSGWFGRLCNEQTFHCSSQTHAGGLCGEYGTCVKTEEGRYTCICQPGWMISSDTSNPTCVDINECNGTLHCYQGVECINVPGSFKCGNCPTGYIGNGIHCSDIDECSEAHNYGGCYSNDWCFNSPGSYRCLCPPDYKGDGKTCKRKTACESNPCSPKANCTDVPDSAAGYRCSCPPGYRGSGIGLNGCVDTCSSRRFKYYCKNGATCVARGRFRVHCVCAPGYIGRRCQRASIKDSDGNCKCRNNGTCVRCYGRRCVDGYRCVCPPEWTGIYCDLQRLGCGGSFYLSALNKTGSLSYPENTGMSASYGLNQYCQWKIETEEDMVLNVTFTKFSLEADRGGSRSNPCRHDNVTLYDGASDTAPTIGSYCGSKGTRRAPDKYILTATNQLFVRFRSDDSFSKDGFTMNFTAVKRVCGSVVKLKPTVSRPLTLTPFSVEKGGYRPGSHCVWYLEAPPGHSLKISVGRTRFANPAENCKKDYLKIYNGERVTDPTLKQFCVNREQGFEEITSGLPAVRVYLHTVNTSSSTTGGWFMMTVKVEKLPEGCGGILNNTDGTIQSPNYPNQYLPSMDCVWIINGTDDYKPGFVDIEFTDIDIKRLGDKRGRRYSYSCNDYVEIREGLSERGSRVGGRICNRRTPRNMRVTTRRPQAYIKFHSNDDASVGNGFSLSYRLLCGRRMQGNRGTIRTPNFPEATSAVRCLYYMNIRRGAVFRLNFTSLNLGNRGYGDCQNDYIKLKGEPEDQWYNVRPICRPGRNYRSGSGDVYFANYGRFEIEFKSSGSGTNFGFEATYDIVARECGGSLYGASGTLSSPLLEETGLYIEGVYCLWNIAVRPGLGIRLKFHNWGALEYHRDCNYDYVEVFESFYRSENDTGRFLGRYCDHPPPPITTTVNRMIVIFRTDRSENAAGFSAGYTTFRVNNDCSRTYSDSDGTITSPKYPLAVRGGITCEFHIYVRPGHQILFKFTNFTVDCEDAHLEIRNGPSAQSPPVMGFRQGRVCGEIGLKRWISHSNRIYMKFNVFSSDASRDEVTGPLFSIDYEEHDGGCGGLLTTHSGSLSSPQYPHSSVARYACTWKINVAKGNLIRIQMVVIDLPENNRACRSKVAVYTGDQSQEFSLQKKFCTGGNVFDSITIPDNRATIYYEQFMYRALYNKHAKKGFLAHFSTLCNDVNITAYNGIIESPGFGSPYTSDRSCNWKITTLQGNDLVLQFGSFRIEDSSNCTENYLQIHPKHQKDYMTLCGNKKFRILRITADFVSLKFRSEGKNPDNSFQLVWRTEGCVKTFTDPNGTITVTNTTGTGGTNRKRECEYRIKAPIGKRIVLKVLTYGRFGGQDSWPYGVYIFSDLKFNSGADTKKNITNAVSDPVIIKSDGNHMLVRIVYHGSSMKAVSKDGAWFKASYKFENMPRDGGCGEILTDTTGVIRTPGYTNDEIGEYANDCSWLIKVPKSHTIIYEVTDFTPGNYITTCHGPPGDKGTRRPSFRYRQRRLTVFDGRNATAKILLDTCKDQLSPIELRSTSNEMLITFRNNRHWIKKPDSKGLNSKYHIGCGAHLWATMTRQSFSISHSFAAKDILQGVAECVWTIESQNPDEHVYLLINNIALYHCSTLIVYDGKPGNDTEIYKHIGGNMPTPPPVSSSGQVLTVNISFCKSVLVRVAFTATYHAEAIACGGDFYSTEGYFGSTGYPNPNPVNAECVYTINVNPSNRVQLTIMKLVTSGTPGSCQAEFLEIRRQHRGGQLIAKLCGESGLSSKTFMITGRAWVRFVTSLDGKAVFNAKYKQENGNPSITGTEGIIMSPYYQVKHIAIYFDSYARRLPSVKWIITIPEDKIFNITIESLILPSSFAGACGISSHLKIKDGTCGNRLTFAGRRSKRSMGHLRRIYRYRNIRSCVLDTFCGFIENEYRIYNTTKLKLLFRQRHNQEWVRFGFRLKWQAINANESQEAGSSDCGTKVLAATTTTQHFVTPGYPNGYAINLDCRWIIQAPFAYKIKLDLVDINLEIRAGCHADYLSISPPDGIDFSRQPKICNKLEGFWPMATVDNRIMIRFRTDRSVAKKGFKMSYQAVCGGIIKDRDAGVITSPGYPQRYPPNTTCSWTIKARPSHTLLLTIKEIDLETKCEDTTAEDGHCCKDVLEIKEMGGLHKKLCTRQQPSYKTSADEVEVNFSSDQDTSAAGFSLQFESVGRSCSEDIILDDDAIKRSIISPMNGTTDTADYYSFLDCEWKFIAPHGRKVKLVINELSLYISKKDAEKYSLKCSQLCDKKDDKGLLPDWVEIRDGPTTISPKLDCLCGKGSSGREYFSTDRVLMVRLVTHAVPPRDSPERLPKTLKFKASASIADCGGAFYSSSGYITSPSYPSSYKPLTNCTWTVEVAFGHRIEFQFSAFHIVSKSGCGDDWIEIRENDEHGELVGRYCSKKFGEIYNKKLSIMGNKMWVWFHTDEKTNGRGFRMFFNETPDTCGGEYRLAPGAPELIIKTPNYPKAYPPSRRCHWIIRSMAGKEIKVSFDTFNVGPEPDASGKCSKADRVLISETASMRPSYSTTFCGSKKPAIKVYGSELHVLFYGYQPGPGFRMKLSSIENSPCGGIITESTKSIKLFQENSTGLYPAKAHCEWIIQNRLENSSIRLNFTNFNVAGYKWRTPLPYGSDCYDGRLSVSGDFMMIITNSYYSMADDAVRCGNNTDSSEGFVFYHNEVIVKFVSDDNTERSGFTFSVKFEECGGILTDSEGVITSPAYPRGYPHNIQCAWLLAAPEESAVMLNITDMEIEQSASCKYDNLTIRNGLNFNSPPVRVICRRTDGESVTRSSNRFVTVVFKADISVNHKGFRIAYKHIGADDLIPGIEHGCGAMLSGMLGTITSPGYITKKHTYPNNKKCIWDISTYPGYYIKLEFKSMSIAGKPGNCTHDYVNITTFPANVVAVQNRIQPIPLSEPLCGVHTPAVIQTGTNFAEITFHVSDKHDLKFTGFELKWQASCGGRYTADKGMIFSPRYPEGYPHNMNCTYDIIPSSTEGGETRQFIVLVFKDIDIADYATYVRCDSNFVDVSSMKTNSVVPGGRTCGHTLPEPVSTDGAMRIRFVTSNSGTGRGFAAVYHQTNCGGAFNLSNLNTRRKVLPFRSPTFPAKLHDNLDCTWNVTTTPGYVIGVTFINISMEIHKDCIYDYLELFDGDDMDPQSSLGRFCGTYIPPKTLKSQTSDVILHLHTDQSSSSDHFRGFFYQTLGIESGCGGEFNVSEKKVLLKSPQSPERNTSGYHPNLYCEYYFRSEVGTVVRLEFEKFELEKKRTIDAQCRYDYVEVHDGIENSPVIDRYCGSHSPGKVTSSGNSLYMLFKTDVSVEKGGFALTYSHAEPKCGGPKVASTAVEHLRPPNYPDAPTPNIRCSWFIQPQEGQTGRVQVHVKKLKIPSTNGACKDNYVEIRDIRTNDTERQIIKLCGSQTGYKFISRGEDVRVTAVIGSSLPPDYEFDLIYQLFNPCNQTISLDGAVGGRLTNPEFPKPYSRFQNCKMTINAQDGYKIQIYFSTLELESHVSCIHDYLRISEPEKTDATKLCGLNRVPKPYVSESNKVEIEFKSDQSIASRGFDLTYVAATTQCGGSITASSGTLMGDNTRATCRWTVSVASGHRIRITVSRFPFKPTDTDCTTRLTIRTTTGTLIRELCSNVEEETPVELITKPGKSSVAIEYKAIGMYYLNGFRLLWNQTEANYADPVPPAINPIMLSPALARGIS